MKIFRPFWRKHSEDLLLTVTQHRQHLFEMYPDLLGLVQFDTDAGSVADIREIEGILRSYHDWAGGHDLFQMPYERTLFASWRPDLTEVEGLGLPAMYQIASGHRSVDVSREKFPNSRRVWRLDGHNVQEVDGLRCRYDVVIARSAVLRSMKKTRDGAAVLNKARHIVNVKTMSLKQNEVHADCYFSETDFSPPADPLFVGQSSSLASTYGKKRWLLISGTVWPIKNQLNFVTRVPRRIDGIDLIIVIGELRDVRYATQILEVAQERGLPLLLLGRVSKKTAQLFMALAHLSAIPMDMRVAGQPEGYPRVLGESIGCNTIPIANYPVTVPHWATDLTVRFNVSDERSIARALAAAEELAQVKPNRLGLSDHEERFIVFCREVLMRCFGAN